MRFKKTEVCQTCAKLKNVCQTCLLDLDYGKLYSDRRDEDMKTGSIFQSDHCFCSLVLPYRQGNSNNSWCN